MKARVRNTTNGYNVYVETDTTKFASLRCTSKRRRISFARNGMLPRRVLRIFKLHDLIFAPAAYDKKEGGDEE